MTRRLLLRLVGLGALTAAFAGAADAHAIHTTQTEIVTDRRGMTVRIKAFADDFSASAARFSGHPVPADSSASDADALRYVRARFQVSDDRGNAVVLESCGMRRESGLFWLCFHVAAAAPGARFGIRNSMLTELHSDQVNIVQLVSPGARKTMLFTRNSTPSVVALPT